MYFQYKGKTLCGQCHRLSFACCTKPYNSKGKMFLSPQVLIYLSTTGGPSLVLVSLGVQAGIHGCRLQAVEVLPHRTGAPLLCLPTEGAAGLAGTPQTRRCGGPACCRYKLVAPAPLRRRATHRRPLVHPSQHHQPPHHRKGICADKAGPQLMCTVHQHMFISLAPASPQTPATAQWLCSGIH